TALYPWNAENILALNNGRPGLRHLEVRQAIVSAINYPAIIDKVTHGVATVAHDIVPPNAIGYTDNPPYRYDPPAARGLLERSGWLPGSDGVRQKGGERLDFTIALASGAANARALAVQLQSDFNAVGMRLTLKLYPYNVIYSYDGPITTRIYDLADYTYTMPWDPDYSVYLDCDEFSPKGENVFAYCDAQVDAGEKAGLSTDDPAARAAIYRNVERRIHATVPFVPLYLLRRGTVHSIDLKGYDLAPSIAPWWDVYRWRI
ncbi:MAG TPA: ABC transporter substrate-binding protein, partial [Candidatus Baltobacteraceae bacterium]|nr:ABC transporter substrate-binding protein [Candidatus Baltobacteraceae bacterium]